MGALDLAAADRQARGVRVRRFFRVIRAPDRILQPAQTIKHALQTLGSRWWDQIFRLPLWFGLGLSGRMAFSRGVCNPLGTTAPSGGVRWMKSFARYLVAAFVVLLAPVEAEEKVDRRHVELAVGSVHYQGRKWFADSESCWLLARDGRLNYVPLNEVTAYRQLSPTFRPYPMNELKKLLLEEFGKEFEVEANGQHLVIAPPGQARGCLTVIDSTSKSFQAFYNRRNIKLDRMETPLVTVVFPNQQQFLSYCNNDQLKRTNGLRGYYHPTSNRVALYLDSNNAQIPTSSAPVTSEASHYGTFRDTLAHETTHQLGFNMGLHSRFGDDPVWMIEGMAMLFEGDANRDAHQSNSHALQRVNRERFVWFLEYRAARRKKNSLEDFLASDYLFIDQTLDAYAEAWALTFFLSETRPAQLASYLKKLAKRTDSGACTPARRLTDFKSSFGRDILTLEVQYLKFMQELETDFGKTSPSRPRSVPPRPR